MPPETRSFRPSIGDIMHVRVLRGACVAATAILLCTGGAGCRSNSPTQPTPPPAPAAGIWTGRIVDQTFGEGTFRAELSADARTSAYRGTWTAVFATKTASGDATSAMVNPLPLAITCAAGGRASSLLNVEGARMSGDYFTLDCAQIVRGSLDLTRQ